ncbi:Uncharacterised protein [Mycobacteroides abscessus subsp. abscessus]|nr:Uncharacterised protein [Mycobacteroides abscessus subsp. abscessus]
MTAGFFASGDAQKASPIVISVSTANMANAR